MKQKLESLLLHAVETLKTDGILERELKPQINIERARDQQHGDFATNLAMILCKQAKMNPRQLAEKIIAILPADEAVTKVELAGPGFINFFIDPKAQYQIISTIHDLGNKFGLSQIGAGKKVQVEFVSANPTGPLHVGHGRGAAYGSAVADLLTAAGFEVEREYYVNDAG
ncbi:arginine--tRNA ligase, partial [Methylococcaceae bacterium HT4]